MDRDRKLGNVQWIQRSLKPSEDGRRFPAPYHIPGLEVHPPLAQGSSQVSNVIACSALLLGQATQEMLDYILH